MSLLSVIFRGILKGGNSAIFALWISLTVLCAAQHQDIRLSLLGITGAGKSTTGNFLLDKKHRFKASVSSNSETFECSDDHITRDGRTIKVVDTPGFLDTRITFSQLQERIIPFMGKTAPGPHALLYVMEAGRFTGEQETVIKMYKNMFGEDILKYTIVVFTKLPETSSEEDFMNDPHSNLQQFLEQCDMRYIFLPSPLKTSEIRSKIDKLYGMIDQMVGDNDGAYYTDRMFEAHQKILEEKLEEQRKSQIKEKEEELNEMKKTVEAEYEDRINRLKNDVSMSKKERDKYKDDLQKTLLDLLKSYEKKIEKLQKDITLGDQKIADLSSYNCLGPFCIRW